MLLPRPEATSPALTAFLTSPSRGLPATRDWAAPGLSVGSSMDHRDVNEELLWQKESFGARSIVHDVMSGAF